jgi:hypothetical protein
MRSFVGGYLKSPHQGRRVQPKKRLASNMNAETGAISRSRASRRAVPSRPIGFDRGYVPVEEQASVLLAQLERENAAAFYAKRDELLRQHGMVREALYKDWLNMTPIAFLEKHSG